MAKLSALPRVRAGVTEGLSANESYQRYQDEAHENDLQGMRRQDYLRLYSQTRELRELGQEAIRWEKDVLPPKTVDRNTEYSTGYGQWVMIYQRTIGESDMIQMPYLIRSNEPLTPEEAEQRALGYLERNPDDYDRRTLGVGYVGTERFVPRGR
jgi:hypothetical protein